MGWGKWGSGWGAVGEWGSGEVRKAVNLRDVVLLYAVHIPARCSSPWGEWYWRSVVLGMTHFTCRLFCRAGRRNCRANSSAKKPPSAAPERAERAGSPPIADPGRPPAPEDECDATPSAYEGLHFRASPRSNRSREGMMFLTVRRDRGSREAGIASDRRHG